jgi:hypothetical protein
MLEPMLDVLHREVVGELTTAHYGTTMAAFKEIHDAITQDQKQVLRAFARIIVGTREPPDFPGVSMPRWDALSPKYVAKKGSGKGFYFHKGGLGAQLRVADPTSWFGEPEVWVQHGKVKGMADAFFAGYDKRGRELYQRIVIDSKTKSGYRRVNAGKPEITPSRLITVPFPNLLGVPSAQAVKALLDEGVPMGDAGYKLSNFQGGAPTKLLGDRHSDGGHRPVLGWYLEWWAMTRTRRVVDQAVSRNLAPLNPAQEMFMQNAPTKTFSGLNTKRPSASLVPLKI